MKKNIIGLLLPLLLFAAENNRLSTNGRDTVPANWSLGTVPSSLDSVTYNGTTAGALDTVVAVVAHSYGAFNLDSTFTGKYWSLQTATDTNYVTNSVFIKPAGTFNAGSGVWCQTGDANFTMANYSGTYTVANMKLLLKGTGTATFSKSTGLMFAYLSMGYPSKTTTFINNSGSQAGAATITIGTGTVSLPSGSYLYWAPVVVGDTFLTAGTNSTFSGAGRIYIIFQNSTAMTYYLPLATYNQTASWVIRKYSNTGAATCIIPNRWPATPTLQFYTQSASSSFYVRIDSTILGNGGFYFGSTNASATARLALNADTLSLNDNLDLISYNTGSIFDSLKACMIIAKYSVTVGSNHTIIPGTSTLLMNGTAKQTITTANKPFYNMIINPSTGIVDSMALNAGCDSLFGSLTLTTGKFKESNKLYMGLDYTNNTNNANDSAIITNSKYIGRNFTRSSGSRAYITGNTYFVGNLESDITTNGYVVGWFYMQKNKGTIVKLMDNFSCNRLQNDSGAFDQNGKTIRDSIQIWSGTGDSATLNSVDTVISRDSIGALSKMYYSSAAMKIWAYSGACSTWSNGVKRMNSKVDKTAGNNVVVLVDSTHMDSLWTVHGGLYALGALKATSIIDTSADSSSYQGNVYVNVLRLKNVAKKWFANGKTVFLGAGGSIYLGSHTAVPLQLNGNAKIYDGGTFRSFTMRSTVGDSAVFENGKKFTFTGTPTVDGTAGHRNYIMPSVITTGKDTLIFPANQTLHYVYIRDNYFDKTITCKRSDSCYSGGGNY